MTKATKQPNGTYDRFDEHLECGDRVLRDELSGAKREYIFKEVTDDGQVVYEDVFGSERSTMASSWQREWERGDLEIVDDEVDLDSYAVITDSSPTNRSTAVRDHYESYDSGSFTAPDGVLTTVGREKIRIDFNRISDDECLCDLTLLVRFDTPSVIGHPAVSKQDWDELTEVSGVTERHAKTLREAGYESIGDLKEASQFDLSDVEGIGNSLAARIKADVGGPNSINPFEIEPRDDGDEDDDDDGALGSRVGVPRLGRPATSFPMNQEELQELLGIEIAELPTDDDDSGALLDQQSAPSRHRYDPPFLPFAELQDSSDFFEDHAEDDEAPSQLSEMLSEARVEQLKSLDFLKRITDSDSTDYGPLRRPAPAFGATGMGHRSSMERLKALQELLGIETAELPTDADDDDDGDDEGC